MDLNLNNLVNVLNNTSSAERSEGHAASEEQLKKWETVSGYHYLLQDIYLDVESPLQTRWLAIICFKNGVEKYWRASRANAISKDEKTGIRSRLFNLINEQNKQLTIQNAHAISRISRYDFPKDWPSLFEDMDYLLNQAQTSNDIVKLHNLLIILNQVIKTISQIRSGKAVYVMQSKLLNLVLNLIGLHSKIFPQWTSNLDLSLMEVDYMVLKNIRRVLPNLQEQLHKNGPINEFMSESVGQLQLLITEYDKSSSEPIERFITCFSKLHLRLIVANPTSFVLLSSSGKILMTYLSILESKAPYIYDENNENIEFWESLALKCFLVVKRILHYIYVKGAMSIKDKADIQDINNSIKYLSEHIFTKPLIKQLVDFIITWYLKLKPSDIESWESEPEEWLIEESQVNWEYFLRPCAQNLFQDLMKYYKDDLTDYILNKIKNELSIRNNMSSEELLQTDALLSVLQLSGHALWSEISFETILIQTLVPQILNNTSNSIHMKILKRRILLIIDEWVPIKCTSEIRIEVFKILINFLNIEQPETNDKIIQLTCINTLHYLVDDYEFEKNDFKPYLNEFIKIIIQLLSTMKLIESKDSCLVTLSIILERSNPLVNYDVLIELVSIINELWKNALANNETSSQFSIIRIFKNIIILLNDKSTIIYPIAIPLISSILSEKSILAEDAFEIWLTLLQYSPNQIKVDDEFGANDEILELSKYLIMGLNEYTEILPVIISITKSYCILYPKHLVNNEIGAQALSILASYLSKMMDDSFEVFVELFDILFVINSQSDFLQFFLKILVENNVFQELLNFFFDDEQPIIPKSKIVKLLSRLVFTNFEFLFNTMNSSVLFDKMLSIWLNVLTKIGSPYDKKVSLLSLIQITGSVNNVTFPVVHKYFREIVKQTLFFIEENNETENGDCSIYHERSGYIDDEDIDKDIQPNGETKRIAYTSENLDPVFKYNLRSFLRASLLKAQSNLDGSQFNELVSSLDIASFEQLQILLS